MLADLITKYGARLGWGPCDLHADLHALLLVVQDTRSRLPPSRVLRYVRLPGDHAFSGDINCEVCGEGRQFYLHTDRTFDPDEGEEIKR